MITTTREEDFARRREGKTVDGKNSKASSSSTPWPRLMDPRIVRVSRAFGRKDRHSKVCTVKGLRDRRIRLSVPTAIQLYDLQERLGLNQPSKVVDWLLNAAKHEIDELPPLQIPPGSFGLDHQHQPLVTSYGAGVSQSNKEVIKMDNSNVDWGDRLGHIWSSDADAMRDKSKEVEAAETVREKEDWINQRNEQEEKQLVSLSSLNFLPRSSHSNSMAGLISTVIPQNAFFPWDPSTYPFSHIGSHGYAP